MTYSLLVFVLSVSFNVKLEGNTAAKRFLVQPPICPQLQSEKFQNKIPVGLIRPLACLMDQSTVLGRG